MCQCSVLVRFKHISNICRVALPQIDPVSGNKAIANHVQTIFWTLGFSKYNLLAEIKTRAPNPSLVYVGQALPSLNFVAICQYAARIINASIGSCVPNAKRVNVPILEQVASLAILQRDQSPITGRRCQTKCIHRTGYNLNGVCQRGCQQSNANANRLHLDSGG